MHVQLKTRKRMPRVKPNLLVMNHRWYRFQKWDKQTMIFSATDKKRIFVKTVKHSDMRFVKSMHLEENSSSIAISEIAAYRVNPQ